MKTRVTELLDIQYPLIQGAMAWIATAPLAAAVSNAGGLGVVACGGADPEWVRDQVAQVRSLTDKPFGVNVMLMNPRAAELAELLAELRVPVITTGAGSPSPYVARWKEAGCKVVPIVASAALARRMEKLGADAVIAEGCEAGGHIGELTTMALTPSVCDAVSIPVITAGGVADGRGLAAAFALGAEGVQMGTRFLAAEECPIHENYQQKILGAKDSDTIVTGRVGGHPVRQLKNKFSRGIAAAEKDPNVDAAALEERLAGSLRRAVEGDAAMGSLMSGQVACLVDRVQPAAEIVAEIMAEAERWGARNLADMAACNAQRAWKE